MYVAPQVLLPTPCVRMTEDLVHQHLTLQAWCKPAEPILCRRCNVQHGEWFRGSAPFQRLKVAEVEPLMVFSVLMVHLATGSSASPDAYVLRGGKVVRVKIDRYKNKKLGVTISDFNP